MDTTTCARRVHLACRVGDLAPDTALQIHIEGRAPIALFNIDGQFHAIDDTCSHGAASLCEGYVENGVVECPFHSATFDIRTGEALTAPASQPVKTYPIRVEAGAVYVELDDEDTAAA
jgi:nitrite reductase/ring-hydroxylating ferredoxin subunit